MTRTTKTKPSSATEATERKKATVRRKRISSPAEAYARAVVSGEIVTGRLVRLACERHLSDLADGAARGLHFDAVAEARVITFFETYLFHWKGEWSGRAFTLGLWQKFILGSLFGWKRADGLRRFRTAYDEIARKNGKSTLMGGVGLYVLTADKEDGAEVYSAATMRKQALIVFDDAKAMVKKSAQLKKRCSVFKTNISVPSTGSKFEPLGADADTYDGLNIHAAIVDELHAHKSRAMWDVLETATGARRQPLLMAITTAGFDRHSVCWEIRDYAVKVLRGIIQDDSFFAYIATLDWKSDFPELPQDDDWQDPENWIKANPGLGVSVKADDMQRLLHKAKHLPGAQNAFQRLRLNRWTEAADHWIDMEAWELATTPVVEEDLRGRPCYGGLDLSKTTDITALVWIFPPMAEGEPWKVLPRFFVPSEGMRKRVTRDRVPYDLWVGQGLIEATMTDGGKTVDYEVVRRRIRADAEMFEVREIAYDPWNAEQLVLSLKDEGYRMEEFRQGFASFSGPTKHLEELILGGKFAHGGNPVLRWMASNVAVRQDPAGNLKPDKDVSTDRIDGIVAAIMALGQSVRGDSEQRESIYETEDMMVL